MLQRGHNHLLLITQLAFACLVLSVNAFGQYGTTTPDRGAKLGNSFSVGQFDTVNATTGALMLNFPLASLPAGRGSATSAVALTYNSKLYRMHSQSVPDQLHDLTNYDRTVIDVDPKGGWRLNYGTYGIESETRWPGSRPDCGSSGGSLDGQLVYQHKLKIVFPDGSTHEMIPYGHSDTLNDRYFKVTMEGMLESCTGLPTYTTRPVYYSRDGSFLRLETTSSTSWTLYFADGSKVVNGNQIYDRNGNYVSGLTDQFARSITLGTSGEYQTITSQGVGGEDVTWKIKWKNIWVFKTYEACNSNHTHCHNDGTFSAYPRDSLQALHSVVEEIVQPDQLGGRSYKFTYNGSNTEPQNLTYGWGEVSGVELPSEAKVTYTYSMDDEDGPSSIEGTKEILKNKVTGKTLKYDLEYDGQVGTGVNGATEIWGYGTGPEGGGVTAPDGSVTSTGFVTTDSDSSGYVPWDSGLTHTTISPDGTKVENIWDRNIPTGCHGSSTCPGVAHADNPYIKTTFTSIKENGGYAWTAIKDFTYDMNGNVIEERDYDYIPYGWVNRQDGRPAGVPETAGNYLKRVTKTEFWNQAPTAQSTAPTPPTSYDENIYIFASPYKFLNLAKSVEIKAPSGATKSRSEMDYDHKIRAQGIAKAGNLTTTRTWDSTKLPTYLPNTVLNDTNSVSTQATYNDYGMPVTTTDANSVVTEITYGSIVGPNATYTDLYPTQAIAAYGTNVARTSSSVYDFYTGLVTESKDVDNNLKVITEFDDLGRPIKVRSAAGEAGFESWTETLYYDQQRMVVVKSDLEAVGDGKKVAIQHFDQLGRVRLARTLEDPTVNPTDDAHGIKVQTRYRYHSGSPSSDNGEYTLVSNPYRAVTSSEASSEPTMGWKVAFESKSGNLQTVEFFSGSGLPSLWGTNMDSTGRSEVVENGKATTTTDEAGKVRRTIDDGLGHLIEVHEPNLSGQLGDVSSPKTTYEYDALGNLLEIVQGEQTRTFAYTSLSRLASASNPESGTFQFAYDLNGNLKTKIDARNITTTFLYDDLNRVTRRDYSDATPPVVYTYDDEQVAFSKGKLTKVASTVSESLITAYDARERIKTSQQKTAGQTYDFGYTYNLADGLVTQTYPSTKTVEFDYDSGGNLAAVGNSAGWTYANSFIYTPRGEIERVRLGNRLWEAKQFNPRHQVTQIGVGYSSTNTGVWKTNYEYGDWQGSTLDAAKNNGNLARQTITVPTIGAAAGFTAIQTYAYDSLDRLKSAAETIGGSSTWKQTFLYDRFGNRNFDTGNTTILSNESTAAKVANPEILQSNNKFKLDQDNDTLEDYGYDSAGNLTRNAAGFDFAFNAENLQTSASGSAMSMAYSYDGNNKRVKTYDAINNKTTIFVYDANGQLAAEYTINVTPPSVPVISYTTDDALGSPRLITNSFAEVKARRDFLPFGEELYAGLASRGANQKYSSPSDDVRKKFATYQRDIETGLDFAQSRYYSPMHGRFTSPDEFKGGPDELFDFEELAGDNPTFYADLRNPQSLNKYQYGYNNPYRFNDPTGHCPPLPACLQNPAISDRINRIADAATKTFVGGTIIAGITAAANTVKTAFEASAQAGVGDPWCKGCNSSQNIMASYRPQQQSGATSSNSTSSSGASASSGGANGPPQQKNTRSKNKIQRDPDAAGAHSRFKRNGRGKIDNYVTYDRNGNARKRFRGAGGTHGGIEPPIKYRRKRGKGRNAPLNDAAPAKKYEIPK